ncbi:hypothetical protein POSPLADRAFT_1036653 [Postia placenta MAD-698-R-SB12]|uniref:Uncharacterized protein n=1 Tax=Postia placenta MAD-698-R-SB12 TaxID=670580 RepID=A0A1X6MMA2_9APHY|nr:hypothetical protein POSPLADRAFT_1036653 [Postia placenta MAD-698-R-SB12]OSX57561.1 hypothetical protein POSPLADRAFT_1036653 [Postia placenta MAD-698-R-SB12]
MSISMVDNNERALSAALPIPTEETGPGGCRDVIPSSANDRCLVVNARDIDLDTPCVAVLAPSERECQGWLTNGAVREYHDRETLAENIVHGWRMLPRRAREWSKSLLQHVGIKHAARQTATFVSEDAHLNVFQRVRH